MPKKSIRFGIRDGQGHRAATWKLWAQTGTGKSDLYLTCRKLGGALKTSLHESGSWHIAYTQGAFGKYLEGLIGGPGDRFIDKWSRPKPIAPGITLACQIVTPFSAVTSPITGIDRNVRWIPNAPDPKANEISIVLTALDVRLGAGEWPAKRSMGTSCVGNFQLDDGHMVWVVYRVIDFHMPYFPEGSKGRFFKGRGRKDLETDALRAIGLAYAEDGTRILYDCAVIRSGEEHRAQKGTET